MSHNKTFTGYYGSHNDDQSKNNHYYGSQPTTNDQTAFFSSPSVYIPTSTPYTTTTPSIPSYTPTPISTPYVGSTSSTPYVSSDSKYSSHHYEPKNLLTSHTHILAELRKKKNPTHYSVYRFSVQSATIYDAYDSNGLADPYVKVLSVKMKDRRDNDNVKYKPLFKTNVCNKTLSPSWEHEQLVILKNNIRYIDFEVYDKDLISDDYIGGVRVDIALPETIYGAFNQFLKLTNEKDKVVGTIFCNIKNENLELN